MQLVLAFCLLESRNKEAIPNPGGAHMSEVNIPSIASTAGSSGLGMAMAPTRKMEDLESPNLGINPKHDQCHSTIPIIPVLCASPSPQ